MNTIKRLLCCCRVASKAKRKQCIPVNQSMISTPDSYPFEDDDSCCSYEFGGIEEEEEGRLGFEVREGGVITTRAQFTYGLERFEKNAMIILANSEEKEERIQLLKRSFEKYRFHAEAHTGLSRDAMEDALTEFFGRDLSQVGAVVIVVLSSSSESSLVEVQGKMVHESLLLRWLTADQPAALQGKPKIYITEADRTGVAADNGVYSLPITNLYQDVVGIHIPVVINKEMHPLRILCDTLGSQEHFLADVFEAAHLAEKTIPELRDRPLQIGSTLLRNVRLAVAPEQEDGDERL